MGRGSVLSLSPVCLCVPRGAGTVCTPWAQGSEGSEGSEVSVHSQQSCSCVLASSHSLQGGCGDRGDNVPVSSLWLLLPCQCVVIPVPHAGCFPWDPSLGSPAGGTGTGSAAEQGAQHCSCLGLPVPPGITGSKPSPISLSWGSTGGWRWERSQCGCRLGWELSHTLENPFWSNWGERLCLCSQPHGPAPRPSQSCCLLTSDH